jgi:hypothetical protein
MKENYETVIRDHVLAEKRLRDAAPDLLEALEGLLSGLGKGGYVLPAGAVKTARARAAIAKAKGE